MPCSFVIYCHPEIDLPKGTVLGKRLHDGFLALLSPSDSQITQQISRSKVTPFTLSPLFGKVERGGVSFREHIREGNFSCTDRIKAGTLCRLRVSVLDDSLGKRMEEIVGGFRGGISLSIGDIPLKIGDAFFARESRDPWVNWKGYRELYEDASPSMLRVTLQFVTATAFERRSGSLPLPDPQLVFRGYLNQWRCFSPVPFSSSFTEMIDRFILLTDFNISPVSYETGEGKQRGFTGWCEFFLVGRHPEKQIREFNALVDYAFYCGTGRDTTLGMGVTRRVSGTLRR